MTLTARRYSEALLQGPGIINPVTIPLVLSTCRALQANGLFGAGESSEWVQLQTASSAVSRGFFLSDSKQTSIDGSETSSASRLIFPKVTTDVASANRLVFVNTSARAISTFTTTWSKISGPGISTFSSPNAVATTGAFLLPGIYTLRLTASDGGLLASSDGAIVVNTCGATVSGRVTGSANASDNVRVVGLEFKVDGANFGAELTNAPYSMTWSTKSVSNCCHTLTAVARDFAGDLGTASVLTFVSN